MIESGVHKILKQQFLWSKAEKVSTETQEAYNRVPGVPRWNLRVPPELSLGEHPMPSSR
jgi:hypothetical protein